MSQSKPLHIFTVATHKNHHVDRLLKSCERHHINIQILGLGIEYPGNGMKVELLTEALKTLPKDDLFLYLDAYDVIFLTDANEIREKYLRLYDGHVLFGAETNFGMYSADDLYYYLKNPIKTGEYRFLNAGTIMGPVAKALSLYEQIGISKEFKSDQMETIRYYCKNPNGIKLDQTQDIIAVNGGRAGLESVDYEIKNNRIYAHQTNNWPCLLHVPGKFFIGLDQLSQSLGYMDHLPEYSLDEQKNYQSAAITHKRCRRVGLDPYQYRLIKNWVPIILLILCMALGIQTIFN